MRTRVCLGIKGRLRLAAQYIVDEIHTDYQFLRNRYMELPLLKVQVKYVASGVSLVWRCQIMAKESEICAGLTLDPA